MKKNKFPKFIVVTGGVLSGVGKGIATASIGMILKNYGYKVTTIKIDPYINFDAGTLRPTEHGEVWVTDDGGEIDQDLGNYERFLNQHFSKKNNITTGQVYSKVIEDERKGKFLGQTVQLIPHISDEIKRRIKEIGNGYEFVLIEIGGTIGDYENIPYLFAVKSLEREIGEENVKYVLITYLPTPKHIGEMKTKPTQQAIKLLSEHGIFPNFILCRAKEPLDSVRKKKIEIYANIDSEHVISAPDIDTLYRVPLNFEKDELGKKILKEFSLKARKRPDWSFLEKTVNIIENPKDIINIAMVGKYIDIGEFSLKDSYISVAQALEHSGAKNDCGVKIDWISAQDVENGKIDKKDLKKYNGFIVPGGFGKDGVEGKIKVIRFARENNIPYLGLCFGMQLAIVEFARNVCKLENANSVEIDPYTKYPVIHFIENQKNVIKESRYGGTMRLGAYAAHLVEGTLVYRLYKETGRIDEDKYYIEILKKDKENSFRLGYIEKDKPVILERHRHRYEVNNQFVETLEKNGIIFSGYHNVSKDEKLMEFIELKNHRFFVATQSHPEFRSTIFSPSPLFFGFVRASLKLKLDLKK
ncbi:MAG: CTP synthase (glutamine hydrolyzing) [candidate division WOR-3 bacterium]